MPPFIARHNDHFAAAFSQILSAPASNVVRRQCPRFPVFNQRLDPGKRHADALGKSRHGCRCALSNDFYKQRLLAAGPQPLALPVHRRLNSSGVLKSMLTGLLVKQGLKKQRADALCCVCENTINTLLPLLPGAEYKEKQHQALRQPKLPL